VTTSTTGRDALSARAGELARAAAAPVIAAALLLALLYGWVADDGMGTLARVRLQISAAIVPMPATPEATAAYLTIRNTGAEADELLSASTASAASTMLAANAAAPGAGAGAMTQLGGIPVPAHGSVTLGPYADDITLMSPAKLSVGQTVVLVLDFRVVGQVTVDATVAPVGTA
jgi:hypothetical protein